MQLTLGPAGRAALLAEAAREGTTATGLVAARATSPRSFSGAPARVRPLDDGLLGGMRECGRWVNMAARAANTVALAAARDPVDEGEAWSWGRQALGCAEVAVEHLWQDAAARDALAEQAGDGPRAPSGAFAGEGPGRVCVRLSGGELSALDACARGAGLARSQWVLVSCTPLLPGWRAADAEGAAALAAEADRQRANITQLRGAARRAGAAWPPCAPDLGAAARALAPVDGACLEVARLAWDVRLRGAVS